MTLKMIGDLDAGERARGIDWLTEHGGDNLGVEILLRKSPSLLPGWRAEVLTSEAAGVTGVSILSPEGSWFVHSSSRETCSELTRSALHSGVVSKVNVAGSSKEWVRDSLQQCGEEVIREHDLLVMRCQSATGISEGRWATLADVTQLAEYKAQYDLERGTQGTVCWSAKVRAREVAVLKQDGQLTAVVCRSGATPRVACIGGTYTFPGSRRRGFAKRLCTFIVSELLQEVECVQLIVDDDNHAAIALYESLGFASTGRNYMAYLR